MNMLPPTKIGAVSLILLFILSTMPAISSIETDDFDPLVDIELTFQLKEIRAYDTIDRVTDPDFYVKLTINDREFTSPIWYNTKYVKESPWSVTCNVPDDETFVDITIQLWDWNAGRDKLCDISYDFQTTQTQYDVELEYDLRSGYWWNDDYSYYEPVIFDPSGYGRLNGCDDNSIYEEDRDCELLFDITQTDPDGDGIPYWAEMNIYETDPELDNTGEDADGDGVPIEWEHRWKYDPTVWDDHAAIDLDDNGLDNIEEYLTSQWGSDPFRKDIFLELDQMEDGPNGEGNLVPENSKEMLRDAYGKHNIFFHLDDGSFGEGELIPFDENTSFAELNQFYWEYFMHEDPDNWRRGVFHYALVTYHQDWYHGFVFGTEVEGKPTYLDSLQISTKEHEVIPFKYPFMRIFSRRSFDKQYHREIIYASALMHETGHTLGIFNDNTPGCDNQTGKFPWEKNWWVWRNYKSCMNYGWMYTLVDYSNGLNGKNDFDDWNRIDLTFFQRDRGY